MGQNMAKKSLDYKKITFLILAAGILVRALYVIFMPVVNFAQYDIGTVDIDNNVLTGHLGYIFYLYKNHSFVPFDPREIYQFNHPPVHHIICAVWISFIGLFTDSTKVLIESVQFITLIYSVITLFAFERILDELEVPKSGKAFALLIFAFQPTLIMTAGSVNNDGIGLMFQVLAVWFTVRWYKTRAYKDIFAIALSVAIGMLSKLSAGLVAFPIAVLFLYTFIADWKKEKTFPLKRFLQYVVFGCICMPLGLLWVIRCYVKYKMPPTYIAFLPETSAQYVGDFSRFERLFFPNPLGVLKNLAHGKLGYGHNIWMQMLRTSALGECDLATFPAWAKAICLLCIFTNLCMALWAFVAFIRVYIISVFVKKQREGCISAEEARLFGTAGPGKPVCDLGHRLFFVTCYITMMYSYFSFADTYPHECSMNFRYVQLAIVPPLVALSYKASKREEKNEPTLPSPGVILGLAYSLASVLVAVIWCIYA